MDPKEEIEAVLEALENPKYKWRTISGVAQETNLSALRVSEIIDQSGDLIVRSSAPSKDGEALYTTRNHYRNSTSPAQRLFGAIRNRID